MRDKILFIHKNPKALSGQDRSFYQKYDVLILNNASEALEINNTCRHGLIVYFIDSSDPGEFEMLRALKENDRLERPIIAITGNNSIEIERKIAQTGVFYHLLQPFETADFEDLVRTALETWNKKSIGTVFLADHWQPV
jgi:DNA-binding NtrC family response regulator